MNITLTLFGQSLTFLVFIWTVHRWIWPPLIKAMRERQKKCGAEWKEAKAAAKIEKGTTWPKYWSACNKRLKSASK